MAVIKTDLEQKLYAALKRITQYEYPEKLRRRADRDYGIGADECVDMAYENVIDEAKRGLRGVRLFPKKKPLPDPSP